MLSTPITEQAKQLEWNTISTIANNNGFPLRIIHNLKNKIVKTQNKENSSAPTQRKPLNTFTYHSPPISKATNLFKRTNINTAFQTSNTIYNQLHDRTPQTKQTTLEYTY
jgi:hypothetical protein